MWGTAVLGAWGCPRWGQVDGFHDDRDDDYQNKLIWLRLWFPGILRMLLGDMQ